MATKKKAKKDGIVLEDFGISDSLIGDLDDFFSDSNFGDGDSVTAGQVGERDPNLVLQNDLECAQGLDFELNDAENSIIRFAQRSLGKTRKKGSGKGKERSYVTHEDFDEGPERNAFLLIYGFAENLFGAETQEKIDRAIRFFFCDEVDELNFMDAASAIDSEIRVDVVRLRIQFEFWVRDWELNDLPDRAASLPETVEMSAAQHGGLVGVDIAREAWFRPGISEGELFARVVERNPKTSKETIRIELQNLLAYHVLSEGTVNPERGSRFYTTGKNPILKAEDLMMNRGNKKVTLDRIHWSKLF